LQVSEVLLFLIVLLNVRMLAAFSVSSCYYIFY
jgi:hypothetical protein